MEHTWQSFGNPVPGTAFQTTTGSDPVEPSRQLVASLDANMIPLNSWQPLVLSGTDGNCAGGVVDNAWVAVRNPPQTATDTPSSPAPTTRVGAASTCEELGAFSSGGCCERHANRGHLHD